MNAYIKKHRHADIKIYKNIPTNIFTDTYKHT